MLKALRTFWDNLGTTSIDGAASMRRTGRDTYLYNEGDHTLEVYAEMLVGNPARAIDSSGIDNWLPPYNQEEIGDADKERILKNVCLYFEKRQTTYEVI